MLEASLINTHAQRALVQTSQFYRQERGRSEQRSDQATEEAKARGRKARGYKMEGDVPDCVPQRWQCRSITMLVTIPGGHTKDELTRPDYDFPASGMASHGQAGLASEIGSPTNHFQGGRPQLHAQLKAGIERKMQRLKPNNSKDEFQEAVEDVYKLVLETMEGSGADAFASQSLVSQGNQPYIGTGSHGPADDYVTEIGGLFTLDTDMQWPASDGTNPSLPFTMDTDFGYLGPSSWPMSQ